MIVSHFFNIFSALILPKFFNIPLIEENFNIVYIYYKYFNWNIEGSIPSSFKACFVLGESGLINMPFFM